MSKKIIALVITVCTLLSLLAPSVLAADPQQQTKSSSNVNAEIAYVYDDREAIISMTFDDGYYNVAQTLQALFEEYDLYGSLMMVARNSIIPETNYHNGKTYACEALWDELFAKGRLEPQDHSGSHKNLKGDGSGPEITEEFLKSEMDDSIAQLEEYFPDYDYLSFAIPYGSMSDEAYEHATDLYYALRTTMHGVQTLDPDYSTNYGSWYKMRSPSMYRNGTEFERQYATIKGDIDAVVEQNGWYLPIIHKVGDFDPSLNWETELPLETARAVFSYISDLNKAGTVWVTTYSNAIKYVRERQNSRVYAREENGEIYVKVVMNEYAPDGKALPLDVFNHPLTVKVEVPSSYATVYYTSGGVEQSATSYYEDGKNYVKLNVIPDGSDVKVRLSNAHVLGNATHYDDASHVKSCIECGTPVQEPHNFEVTDIITPATCKADGVKECTCADCGHVVEMAIPKNNNAHDFSVETTNYRAEKANCQHGTLYYYICAHCSMKGTTTFEKGDPEEHNFGNKWDKIEQPTETEDGYRERTCRNDGCDAVEREILPKTGSVVVEDQGFFAKIFSWIGNIFTSFFDWIKGIFS